MSNQTESEYEKKFQEDLEKATALSLETLALEQFQRSRLQYSHSDVSVSSKIAQNQRQQQFSNQSRSRPGSFNAGTHIDYQTSPIAPPPAVPPRRHSEVRFPESTDVDDLISFASPTSTKKEDNLSLNTLVEEIQKLNAQVQQQQKPINLNYHHHQQHQQQHQHLQHSQYATNSPQNLQLVPYSGQASSQAQISHSTPLTSEQLIKLYNMQPQMPYCGQFQSQMRPIAMQQLSSGFNITAPFNTSAPQGYGFQSHIYSPQSPNLATTSNNIKPYLTNKETTSVGQISMTPPAQKIQTPVQPQHQIPQMPRSISASGVSSLSGSSSQSNNLYSDVIRRPKKTVGGTDDLIDWGQEDNSRVSVLETFDPLLSKDFEYDNASDCATSYYSEYDPFDYLYSCGTQYSDPVYEAVNRTDRTPMSPGAAAPPIGWNIPNKPLETSSPPPLPPRNYNNKSISQKSHQVLDRRKYSTKLYENVIQRKTYDTELMEFYNMVKDLRAEYKYDDLKTNVGHIVAAEFNNLYSAGTSIKLMVHPSIEALKSNGDLVNKGQICGYGAPIAFTCDISTTVEHVIMHVFCELEGQVIGSVNDFMVKPIGVMEWLSKSSKLSQLECVHNSLKLEHDVQLGLCPKTEENMQAIARTKRDDLRDIDLKPEDILPNENPVTITYDSLMILLETLENEIEKFELAVADASLHSVLTCSGVVQGVKAICALLGSIDTIEIADCVDELKRICSSGQIIYSYAGGNNPEIGTDCGDYAEITLRPKSTLDQVKFKCNQIREAIQDLIDTYSTAFRVDFCVNTVEYSSTPIPVSCVLKPIMIQISSLHRPSPNWKYDNYLLGVQIYHGTRYIGPPLVTQCSDDMSGGLFPRLKFDSWITFENCSVSSLPRESRLIFVLYGCKTEPAEGDQSNDNSQEKKQVTTEIGWCAVQFFDFQSTMILGSYLLSLWPPTTDKYLGPAPAKGSHPNSDFCPVLRIEIPNYGGRIIFPEPLQNSPPIPRFDFNSLDCNLQQELLDTAEQGYPGALDKREVLWEKRHYLQAFPHALPKVLHAALSWDFASLVDLHSLLYSWHPLTPLQALELLLPRYPDLEVRSKAVEWISIMPNDQLVDFLPQLLQALKHDTYETSSMGRFLLCKSLESPRIAHHLYWELVHSLPGDAPQNSMDSTTTESNESIITQARYHRRNKMMLRSLLAICGEKLLQRFLSQNMICKNLADTAQNVKVSKESLRQKCLQQGMETVHQILSEKPTSLPLSPGLEVSGVNIRNSSYFNSNTLPLKVAFLGPDKGILPAIFKSGDDLQQDMLTIQLVRIMDKLWLAQGLDLKMVTFNCVPTGYKKGMIEMVTDAETLRKIQVEYGLTGSFKDKPIAEWLEKKNPSQLEYQRAVDNFTVSCAGYSVATYILGICDRHNDNIMLKSSGHLFHIDFGKFLGDAQMFGNFKRDRTPFVLTSDMAYVINGGDKPSTKFHGFVDLCCKAFNIVRDHGDLILHMLALMATAGIPGVTAEAVSYVRRALLPSQSNPEAAASFAKMIQFSLKSWFTQFNFFLHNLAQMRFTSDDCCGELLSFVPRTYTMQLDGRLKSVMVHGYQKRYDLEKYYTYILRVTRQSQPDPSYLFRSYKEFLEFHQKLCIHFPLAKLHSLPSGIHVGRSNIKTVAERRLPEIRQFLVSLFNSADEIAHSDLVYTFFHPLLRDQQEADIHSSKVKEVKKPIPTENVCGEIKLSLQYRRGALTVMIHHARGLPTLAGGQEPNTYVKCYLKPDPIKATKRKTKVIRKNCVPSFMETLEYRMSLEHIQNRILQVTVWSHDTLQENELLGGFELPLSELNLREELVEWFRLGYLPRS